MIKWLLIHSIRVYQYAIAPLLPKSCRFYPSCSDYMIGAIEKYGILRGIARGILRIIRCQPLCKGGIDFV
jgi:uncharacterized protein